MAAYEAALDGVARRRRGGPGRREPAGADPRQPDDGALEHARLAGAHDRQQERDVGRLRDALRRHGGRVRGDQGRAEDARLRARRAPQRRAARQLVPAVGDRAPALGRAAARPARRGLPAAVRAARPRSSRPTSSATAAATRWSPTGADADVVDEVIAMVDRAEYKRRQAPPGIRITREGVRPRPAAADHQPLRRLAHAVGPAAGRTAIVIAHQGAEPALASSVISTSQTQVCGRGDGARRRAPYRALADRPQEGRWFDWPMATMPVARDRRQVAREVMVSATAARRRRGRSRRAGGRRRSTGTLAAAPARARSRRSTRPISLAGPVVRRDVEARFTGASVPCVAARRAALAARPRLRRLPRRWR